MGWNFAINAMPMTNLINVCADKLAEMWTQFHVIQAKLIMSVWYFTVHCVLLHWDLWCSSCACPPAASPRRGTWTRPPASSGSGGTLRGEETRRDVETTGHWHWGPRSARHSGPVTLWSFVVRRGVVLPLNTFLINALLCVLYLYLHIYNGFPYREKLWEIDNIYICISVANLLAL